MRKVLPLDTWTWMPWCFFLKPYDLTWTLTDGGNPSLTNTSFHKYLSEYLHVLCTWVLFVFLFNKHPRKQYYLQEYTWELFIFKQGLERVHRKQGLISEMQHLQSKKRLVNHLNRKINKRRVCFHNALYIKYGSWIIWWIIIIQDFC